MPQLELCGAVLLAKLLHYVAKILEVLLDCTFARKGSLVVLGLLQGSPQHLKICVGNRVFTIMELIAPDCWNHVSSKDNPAGCASKWLFPTELCIG